MKIRYQIAIHTGIWLVVYILPYVRHIFFNYENIPNSFYMGIGVQFFLNLVTFYSTYFFDTNLISASGKFRLIVLLVLYLALNIVTRTYLSRFFFSYVEPAPWLDKYNSFTIQTILALMYAGLAFPVRFTEQWFRDRHIKIELIQQKQAAELAFLRAQVNPHFLFNTLNNIYSLSLKKSEDTPVSIARLSEIMRYMTSDSEKKRVPLKKELEYVSSYIALQQLRSEDKDFVQLKVSNNIPNLEIAPLMLIPFVENAFKHSNKNAPSPGIQIDIGFENGSLILTVLNLVKETPTSNKEKAEGIGLKNVKRRLDLTYKGNYNLEIERKYNAYKVILTIKLE